MASLQQVVEQLALLASAGPDGITGLNATSLTPAPQGPLELLKTMYKMLFSTSALRDWAIFLIIGSFFETARRLLSALWYWLIDSFFLTATFDENDVSFQWIMLWLSKHPSWKRARSVQVSTSNFDLPDGDQDANSDDSRSVTYLPVVDESYVLWFNSRRMKVTRAIHAYNGGWPTRETLTISIMTRNRNILTGILQAARNEYLKAQQDKITIYVSDTSRIRSLDGWRELATCPKRPLSSIILDPGIIEFVIDDIRDFLDSKQWYAERGIPFRRGYLLYGTPGSGKTSLIHSIAGELGLNVYIVSLSRSGLDDTGLAELISALPERCIALMEDIDAAFHHGLSRESPDVSPAQTADDLGREPAKQVGPPVSTSNRISLSGLLNALDGIGAQEGRVLFATTNKYSSLDPALSRPGRMDLHIEFKFASRFQAEELYRRFYAPSSASTSAHAKESKCRTEQADSDVDGAKVDLFSRDLIDLSELHTPTCSAPPSPSPSVTLCEKAEESDSQRSTHFGASHRSRAPTLSLDRINELAAQFSLAIPERQLSMASLQGFLMMYKTRPIEAVANVGAWTEMELAERKRLEVDAPSPGAAKA